MTDYTIWDPNGNITVFAGLDRAADTAACGKALLEAEERAEQAGFLSYDETGCDVRLYMAGGEFCGNATLSAAAEYAKKTGLSVGTGRNVKVICSGCEEAIDVELVRESERLFEGRLKMPAPVDFKQFNGFPAVIFPGIGHVIVEGAKADFDAKAVIRGWCSDLGTEALGILLFDREEDTLEPYVYVKKLGSIYRENACASGSSAVGYYLAKNAGAPVSVKLKQPGGVLGITVDQDGNIFLEGKTEYLGKKTL